MRSGKLISHVRRGTLTCKEQCLLSLKVEHPPYKWNAAEHYRQEIPNNTLIDYQLGRYVLNVEKSGQHRLGVPNMRP
jgi:hypothetical protein